MTKPRVTIADLPPGVAARARLGRAVVIELHEDGSRHLGETLTEPGPVLVPYSGPRPCTRCRHRTVWATERGRPTHPLCEPSTFDRLTTDAEDALIADFCATFPVAEFRQEDR